MSKHTQDEHHVGELLSGYIDGELTQQQQQRVSLHCEQCAQCSEQLAALEALRERVAGAKLSRFDANSWREDIDDSTVTTSRGIGWLMFVVGLLFAVGIGLLEFIRHMSQMPVRILLILIGIYGGLLLLLFSVLRQRMIESKTDKYKDVEI